MTIPPQSHHLTDRLLLPFLTPTFSAPTYLNTALPPPPSPKPSSAQPTLTSLTSQTQSHISTLSAQTTRLSTTLTALTDDILRCSSRLTYEIEVLRIEATTLVETLSEHGNLNPAIRTFLPNGLPQTLTTQNQNSSDDPNTQEPPSTTHPSQPQPPTSTPNPNNNNNNEPPLRTLQTLLTTRSSLQKITQTFSLALTWPIMPPSLLTPPTSSFITITSPSTQSSTADLEAQGQAALARIKAEITDLLLVDVEDRGGRDAAGEEEEEDGIRRAREKVAELRECVGVWKGTSEERARGKWVGELEGMVEDAERMRGGSQQQQQQGQGQGKGSSNREVVGEMGEDKEKKGLGKGVVEPPVRTASGAGFLRRLRDEIYMD
ncbi:MAG: hypothetical protein Q9186_001876 [Xanthomendoza sp. 1 TL-2023]